MDVRLACEKRTSAYLPAVAEFVSLDAEKHEFLAGQLQQKFFHVSRI
jgi:hypothetical protein